MPFTYSPYVAPATIGFLAFAQYRRLVSSTGYGHYVIGISIASIVAASEFLISKVLSVSVIKTAAATSWLA